MKWPTLHPARRAARAAQHIRSTLDEAIATIRTARALEAGQRTLLDALAPEWVDGSPPDAYVVGASGEEAWTRTLVMQGWPSTLAAGWLAPLLFDVGGPAGDAGDVSVALHVERFTKAQATRLLQGQRVVQASVVQSQVAGQRLDRADTTLSLHSASELALLVAGDQECLFSSSLAITLRAPTREALAVVEQRVRDRFTAPARLSATRWHHAAGYQTAGVPYASDRLGRRRTLNTTSLAFSCPFLTADVGTHGGPLLGRCLADRQPVRLDLWATDEGWTAPHLAMAGVTGGGKTVTLGSLVAEHLTLPDPPAVILVDPAKGDYRRLVRALGGQVIRISTAPTVTINPFDLPPATIVSGTGDVSGQSPVTEQTRLATGLIALMVTEPGPDGQPGRMTRGERAVTERAILEAYQRRGIVGDDAGTWDAGAGDVPVLPDVLAELERLVADEQSPTAASLAERLRPFCTGTLAGLFSHQTTLALDAHLTSFDLEGLDSELRPLAVWLLGDYTWKVAKRDRRQRILSMDEVGTLLEYPESARLVAHLYTLGRAYGLSVWSATQLLSDYRRTPEGERALQSAETVFFLRQAPGKGVQDARERYGLSEGDGAFLEGAAAGYGILRTPKGTARVQVLPSPWLLELMGGSPVSGDMSPGLALDDSRNPAATSPIVAG